MSKQQLNVEVIKPVTLLYNLRVELMGDNEPQIVVGDFIKNGSFGECFKASVTIDGHISNAVIKYPTSADQKEVERFVQEASYIKQLAGSQHIIGHIHGPSTNQEGRNFYLIEEADCNLAQLLTDDDIELSFEEALSLLIGICKGLDFAHTHTSQVVHRDLHPGNVLIIKDNYVPKLCDFGKARSFEEDWQYFSSMEWDLPPHVYVYPPERFFLLNVPDSYQRYVKVDIYSIGILAYTIFQIQNPDLIYFSLLKADINQFLNKQGTTQSGGLLPGVNPSLTIARRQRLYERWLKDRSFDEMSLLRVDIRGATAVQTAAVNNIIQKCVHADHNKRYNSMREMIVELENVITG